MSRKESGCLDCRLGRRGVLKLGLAGIVGALLPDALVRSAFAGAPPAKAHSLIVLWLAGGPSHIDTFDPKPGARTGGPFKAIPTAAAGLSLSEHFPQLAEQARQVALVRSMTSNEGSHGRGTYYLHTGYVPTPTARHPGLGAIVSKEVGDAKSALPNFISLGGPSVGGGLLGQDYSPFIVQAKPGKPVEFLAPPKDVDPARFDARLKLSARMDEAFARAGGVEDARTHQALFARARRLMDSPLTRAFVTDDEPAAVQAAYGQSDFGQRCLVARRLVEAGVRAVEVTLGGWDTHQDNFTRTKDLMGQLDPAFASLLKDLAARDLLSKTLVLCLGEFGRGPDINPRDGRDHHPKAFSVALAGGGTRGGVVLGSTDAEGRAVTSRPVTVPELFATVCALMGIDGKKVYMAGDRPVPLVNKGRTIAEIVV
ncbi:MAG: DUF1501 domain-containing protein [Candidatus Wallbacteria bacterium]|nr:DUF1501 domain-containing protein [Candidatus Wallbacteria bacterium]